MPTRSSRGRDFTTVAKRVVEQAIGEQWDGTPLPDKDVGKNPTAVALGKLGGPKGGTARAAALSSRKRSMKRVRLPKPVGKGSKNDGAALLFTLEAYARRYKGVEANLLVSSIFPPKHSLNGRYVTTRVSSFAASQPA